MTKVLSLEEKKSKILYDLIKVELDTIRFLNTICFHLTFAPLAIIVLYLLFTPSGKQEVPLLHNTIDETGEYIFVGCILLWMVFFFLSTIYFAKQLNLKAQEFHSPTFQGSHFEIEEEEAFKIFEKEIYIARTLNEMDQTFAKYTLILGLFSPGYIFWKIFDHGNSLTGIMENPFLILAASLSWAIVLFSLSYWFISRIKNRTRKLVGLYDEAVK